VTNKTSILIGQNASSCSEALLAQQLITNWQDLAPAHVNTTRILVVSADEQGVNDALNKVKDYAQSVHVAWRHESYTTYGDPRSQTWNPPLADPTIVEA
jgi:hypothetical protein